MTRQVHMLAAVGVASALIVAQPAAAAVKIATYTGTIASGLDVTGIFVAPGADLAGYAYVATYTYDWTLGGTRFSDGITNYSYGGLSQGNGSPVLAATFTLNGVTKSLTGSFYGVAFTSTSSYVQHLAQESVRTANTVSGNYVYNINYAPGAPGSLDSDFGPVAASGGQGLAVFNTIDSTTGERLAFASANLGGDAVYSVGDAVPEPATWALMIGGFGMVGGALRRRVSLAAA